MNSSFLIYYFTNKKPLTLNFLSKFLFIIILKPCKHWITISNHYRNYTANVQRCNAWLSCIIIWYQSVLAHSQTYCYIILFTVFSSFRPKEAYVKFQRSNHRSAPYVRKFLIADFWNYTIVFKLFPQPLFFARLGKNNMFKPFNCAGNTFF